MFTRDTVRGFRNVLQFELDQVAKKMGVKINVGSARFSANNVTFKVELAKISDDGEVLNQDAEDFKMYARRWGLKAEDLGRKIRYAGSTYEIAGAKPRSYKFPILAKRLSDGKVYKLPVAAVVGALQLTGG